MIYIYIYIYIYMCVCVCVFVCLCVCVCICLFAFLDFASVRLVIACVYMGVFSFLCSSFSSTIVPSVEMNLWRDCVII